MKILSLGAELFHGDGQRDMTKLIVTFYSLGIATKNWIICTFCVCMFLTYFRVRANAKCTIVQALRLCSGRTALKGSRGIGLLFLDHDTRMGWGVSVTPRSLFTPQEKPSTHYTGGLVGPRAGLDRCGKSHSLPAFDPRTVQPVASRYTDWATRPYFRVNSGYFCKTALTVRSNNRKNSLRSTNWNFKNKWEKLQI